MSGFKMRSADSGGVAEVLRIATPLVMAAAGHAINLFSDRMMLAWHSADAVSAALPAGLTCFALSCFFFGSAGYVNTFVAQYVGAGCPKRVGVSVWQGIYFALIGGSFMATGYFWAEPLFRFFGHAPAVQLQQVAYFKILAPGSALNLLCVVMASFWSGRGRTSVIMAVSFLITALNVSFNYALIFGHCGFKPMGIAGAGIGTVLSEAVGLAVYAVLFFRREMRVRFDTWPKRTFDPELFRRLVRYGAPNGMQIFLDLAAFNAFVVLLGRMGKDVQEASGIAFAMNALAFIPMIGIGQTVSILVGQSIGAGDIAHAKRSVRSAMLLTFAYMGAMGVMFALWPDMFLRFFRRAGDPEQVETLKMAASMLRYIAAYLVFDGLFIVYGGAIKGAGDTAFAMWVGSALSWLLYAIPCMAAYWHGASVWTLWAIMVANIMISGLVFYWRYRAGKWESMRVIETAASPPSPDCFFSQQ